MRKSDKRVPFVSMDEHDITAEAANICCRAVD